MSHPHTPTPSGQTHASIRKNCITPHADTTTSTPTHRQEAPPAASTHRCSQPLSTNQTPHPTTKAGQQPEPPHHHHTQQRWSRAGTHPHSGMSPRACCLRTQQCVWQSSDAISIPAETTNVCCAPEPHPLQAWPISRIARPTEPPHDVGGAESRGAP